MTTIGLGGGGGGSVGWPEGRGVTLLPGENYTVPESVSVVQTHSNRSKYKNVHNSHV